MPTGIVELSLCDPNNYKNPISVHTGNFFQLTDDIDGAAATDRFGGVIGIGIFSKFELDEPDLLAVVPIKLHSTFSDSAPQMVGDGMPYDQRIYIYLDHVYYSIDHDKRRLLGTAAVCINTLTGDFKVIPPRVREEGLLGLFARFYVTRVPESVKVTIDASQIVPELNRAFDLLDEFGTMKISERDAMQLATHKHYKGGLYREIGPIRDADTGTRDRTLYFHLWPKDPGPWHRNTDEFNGMLLNRTQRFARIEDGVNLFATPPAEGALSFEVNLFRLNVEQNGIFLSTSDAITLVNELNTRPSVGGEYGQPNLSKEGGDRAFFIEAMNHCCEFSEFRVVPILTRKGKQVTVISATVRPSGLRGMDFLDAIVNKDGVGFAMRLISDEVNGHTIPKKIITFDFVSK